MATNRNNNRTDIDNPPVRSQRRSSAADKIAEQRRRRTALDNMQGPRLSTSRPEPSRSVSSRSRTTSRAGSSNSRINILSANKKTGGIKKRTSYKPLFGKRSSLSKYKMIIGGAIILFLLLIIFIFTHKNAIEVFVDGQSVGVVLDKSYTKDYITETCTAKLKSSLNTNVQITSEIEAKKVHAGKNDPDVATGDYLLKKINETIKYNVEASTIVINGTEMAVVSNEEAAKTVVDRILSEHDLDYVENTSDIIEGPEIVGLEYSTKFVDGADILTTDQAYEKLNGTKTQEVTYTVVAGDSIGKIASRYGISTAQLMETNPNLKNNTVISIGDQIKVNATVPLLDIRVVTQTVDRSSGSAAIIKTTYINGIETDEETIDSSSSYTNADEVNVDETNVDETNVDETNADDSINDSEENTDNVEVEE